jgi:hypothetical protein
MMSDDKNPTGEALIQQEEQTAYRSLATDTFSTLANTAQIAATIKLVIEANKPKK